MVGVVKQDYVAGVKVAGGASNDALGRRELPPVLAPARPEKWFEAERERGVEPGARVDAERRAVVPRRAADDLDSTSKVLLDEAFGETQVNAVAIAVNADFMAAIGDLAGQFGIPSNLLTDEKEDRPDIRGVEQVQHSGSALRMRTIIERQRGLRPIEATRNAG